jgi:ferredoxin--NADP+ reductase
MRPRAKGRFTLRTQATHHVMVSTVTGIAPFVSMIRQAVHDLTATPIKGRSLESPASLSLDGSMRLFVMHGASYRDELVYDSELKTLSAQYPALIDYVASVSRPADPRNAGWHGPTGRINLLVEESLAKWALPKERTVIYVCGNPGMIADVKTRVMPQGWSIAEEQYWRVP